MRRTSRPSLDGHRPSFRFTLGQLVELGDAVLSSTRPVRARRREGKVQQLDDLPHIASRADGHDPVFVPQLDSFHGHRHPEDLGIEREAKPLLEHRVPAGSLLCPVVSIHRPLLDHLGNSGAAESGWRAGVSGLCGGSGWHVSESTHDATVTADL